MGGMFVEVSKQSKFWGIDPYVDKSTSTKSTSLWQQWLVIDWLSVIFFCEDMGSIPTRHRSLHTVL